MRRRRCDERIRERIRGRVPRILAAREQHRPRQPDSRRIVIDVAARVRINQFIRGGFEMRERDHRVRQRWGRLLRIPRPPARLHHALGRADQRGDRGARGGRRRERLWPARRDASRDATRRVKRSGVGGTRPASRVQ